LSTAPKETQPGRRAVLRRAATEHPSRRDAEERPWAGWVRVRERSSRTRSRLRSGCGVRRRVRPRHLQGRMRPRPCAQSAGCWPRLESHALGRPRYRRRDSRPWARFWLPTREFSRFLFPVCSPSTSKERPARHQKPPICRPFSEGERWDSNPRPPGPQPGALPAELRPPRRQTPSLTGPRAYAEGSAPAVRNCSSARARRSLGDSCGERAVTARQAASSAAASLSPPSSAPMP
jgi:hypothetical protein